MRSLAALTLSALFSLAGAIQLNVNSTGGITSSPLQYGLIFEDINHSGDGGLYAELIRNRAFQANSFANATIYPFRPVNGAVLTIQNTSPVSHALPYSINVAIPPGTNGPVGFSNPGWWGIDVKPQLYTGFFWVYGAYQGNFTASLYSDITKKVFATTNIPSSSSAGKWTRLNYTMHPSVSAPSSNNSFSITFDPIGVKGSLNFNLISLFPPTYKNRPNGMRVDLMESLADLKPSFLRMPGGNNLQGNGGFGSQWKWNETIGYLMDRPGRDGAWGYYNTDGIGLAEYFNWCIDLGMEPILAVFDGLYQRAIPPYLIIAENMLAPYVQDSLNELEYVMGSINTTYGALRASHGNPDPWKLKYFEIGNEDNLSGGELSYEAYRFSAYYTPIHKLYPDLIIVSSTIANTIPDGAVGGYHQYATPDFFVKGFSMFDQNNSHALNLVGEYAVIQPNSVGNASADFSLPQSIFPFWMGTVSEAVFLIGTERNTGKVLGAAYAPTLQNLNSYEWAPDMISFTADPAQDVHSTSYHMVKLFSGTRFTEMLPVTSTTKYGPAYWVAGRNTATGSHILKVAVYNSTGNVPITVSFAGVSPGVQAILTLLTAPNATSYAQIGSDPVITTITTLTAGPQGFSFNMPDLSIALLATNPESNNSTNLASTSTAIAKTTVTSKTATSSAGTKSVQTSSAGRSSTSVNPPATTTVGTTAAGTEVASTSTSTHCGGVHVGPGGTLWIGCG